MQKPDLFERTNAYVAVAMTAESIALHLFDFVFVAQDLRALTCSGLSSIAFVTQGHGARPAPPRNISGVARQPEGEAIGHEKWTPPCRNSNLQKEDISGD